MPSKKGNGNQGGRPHETWWAGFIRLEYDIEAFDLSQYRNDTQKNAWCKKCITSKLSSGELYISPGSRRLYSSPPLTAPSTPHGRIMATLLNHLRRRHASTATSSTGATSDNESTTAIASTTETAAKPDVQTVLRLKMLSPKSQPCRYPTGADMWGLLKSLGREESLRGPHLCAGGLGWDPLPCRQQGGVAGGVRRAQQSGQLPDCWAASAILEENSDDDSAYVVINNDQVNSTGLDRTFVVDSGATEHMVSSPALLHDLRPLSTPRTVRVGNGQRLAVSEKGTLLLNGVTFKDVYVVPGLDKNLLSCRRQPEGGEWKLAGTIHERNMAMIKDRVEDSAAMRQALAVGEEILQADSEQADEGAVTLLRLAGIEVASRSSFRGHAQITSDYQAQHVRYGAIKSSITSNWSDASPLINAPLDQQAKINLKTSSPKRDEIVFMGSRKTADNGGGEAVATGEVTQRPVEK
ncbi:hypothetical protein B9479_005349 [Cryptococcus floricola]|uniref:Retrovirus-related Pol polyprotein from transposon TNT 1-94-like beta-barrel domain-containing protein n=1 Tax=Cryptococcus floricola TaxID=2591691 RepID=A0A5D3ARB1_9TREE|nr:hypothetical protein B9479_005349 [Cryptococcus floricola]